MKFLSTLIFTLALAASANAYFRYFKKFDDDSGNNIDVNLLDGSTDSTENPHRHFRNGHAGFLHKVLRNLPGSENLLKNTFNSFPRFLDAFHGDLKDLIAKGVEVDHLSSEKGEIIQNELGNVKERFDYLERGLEKLTNQIHQVEDVMQLPKVQTRGLGKEYLSVLKSLTKMVMNGAKLESVAPKSMPALSNLFKSVFADIKSNPLDMVKFGLRMFLPSSLSEMLAFL